MPDLSEKDQIGMLKEFIRWMITQAFEGCEIAGSDAQDKAVEYGILVKVAYDPDLHGDSDIDIEVGDEWFVYSDDFKRL